jgi:membrane-associated phospholipid phosphatase
MDMNLQLLLAINTWARSTPWLQPIMSSYATVSGIVIFAELMFAGWWVGRKRADLRHVAAALWTPIGMLLALAINEPLTTIVAEPRPYMDRPELLILGEHKLVFGFPSHHAVFVGAITASLFLVSRQLGCWAALAALIMAFSRVYIAAAYPADVLAGLFLGAMVSLISFGLVRRPLIRLLGAADPTVFRALVTAGPRTPQAKTVAQSS